MLVETRICKNCKKEFSAQKSKASKYCCLKCAAEDRNTQNEVIQQWVEGKVDAIEVQSGITQGELRAGNKPAIKQYLSEEQQHKCAICGCGELWNNKFLVFIIDHVDGNSRNNIRSNLRLICPNCDSQLDTYKSKNIGKGRTSARQFYADAHHNGDVS